MVNIYSTYELLMSLIGNHTVHISYRWDGDKFELENVEIVTTEVALMLNSPPPD